MQPARDKSKPRVRERGIARDQRVCQHCDGGVEDEEHFLLHCSLYSARRAALRQEVLNVTRNASHGTGLRSVDIAAPEWMCPTLLKLQILIGSAADAYGKEARVRINGAVKSFVTGAFATRRRWHSDVQSGANADAARAQVRDLFRHVVAA